MALPADFNTGTVTATYVDLAGDPIAGSVTFTAVPHRLVSDGTDTIVITEPLVGQLAEGVLNIVLPATDDPDISPTSFTYRVKENFTNGLTYFIDVPVGSTTDLSDVTPVDPSTGNTVVREVAPITYAIPLVGQWNPPLITETATGLTQNVFFIGCRADPAYHPEVDTPTIAPAPPLPFMVEVAQPTAPPVDPPELPTLADVPEDWTPISGQEIEEADIYGVLMIPLDYTPLEHQGVPTWIRGRSVDDDGFETLVYLWLPAGVGPGIVDVDVVMFSEGVRSQFTIPAAPDGTTPGTPVDMTVYAGGPVGAATALAHVAARAAAAERRLTELEP